MAKKTIIPLPFKYYYWPPVIITLGGIADSLHLSISHYRVYSDIGYRSFCAISKAVNCDTVSQSQYAVFLGLPLAVWGVIGYAFYFMLLLFAKSPRANKQRMWALLFFMALAFSIYSIILALISTFVIHSYCLMCILLYIVNFSLVFYAWLIHGRFEKFNIFKGFYLDVKYISSNAATFAKAFAPFGVALVLALSFFPKYWEFNAPEISQSIPRGVTPEGHPWIGAKSPEIVIVEFADYQCFQCRKMHFFLRQIIESNPDKLRLVHRHFPMDHRINPLVEEPFHLTAGVMAIIAEYAITEDKFWEVSDYLFEISANKGAEVNLTETAEKFKLDYKGLSKSFSDQEIMNKIYNDIKEGIEAGITGTPGFIIDGKLYQEGTIPPEIISRALD